MNSDFDFKTWLAEGTELSGVPLVVLDTATAQAVAQLLAAAEPNVA